MSTPPAASPDILPARTPRDPAKPLRKQVSRACEWCRARRIKCDNGRPCRNCQLRGGDCINNGKSGDARSLTQALGEIERLRHRVKDLEAQVDSRQSRAGVPPPDSVGQGLAARVSLRSLPTPSESPLSSTDTPAASNLSPDQTTTDIVKVPWEGIHVASARSEQTSYYGPSSTFYFISRLGEHLSTALQQPIVHQSMQPRGANKTLTGPVGHADSSLTDNTAASAGGSLRTLLSRSQEEYFISLFWESCHCTLPIVDEGSFRRLYASLWDGSSTRRKQSPLVDIILAVSMQYGCSFLPRSAQSSSRQDGRFEDATVAGWSYYRRCQTLLAYELESPSLTTMQCHIYSLVYLCCASFQNMAHTTIALAICTAQSLGLHFEPPADMPRGQRELRKRIWWVLQTIEIKTCMKLGRPFTTQRDQVTTTLPSDDLEAASLLESSLGSYGADVTWLTYSVQCQRLVGTACTIHWLLYDKFADVLTQRGLRSPYTDPTALEACADYLTTLTPLLHAWLAELPPALQTPRRPPGTPFSTDRSPLALDADADAPLWLRRQCLYIELLYHTLSANLFRPFVTFSPSHTPAAERHASACAAHSIAVCQQAHQALAEGDLLNGWQEGFQWLWNATVCVAGHLAARPAGPATQAARRALAAAVAALELFGENFAVAQSAAGLARDLAAKADALMERFRAGAMGGGDVPGMVREEDEEGAGEGQGAADGATGAGYYSDFMEWALTVDEFNSLENLYADTCNPADLWMLNGQWPGVE